MIFSIAQPLTFVHFYDIIYTRAFLVYLRISKKSMFVFNKKGEIMKMKNLVVFWIITLLLSACGQKEDAITPIASAAAAVPPPVKKTHELPLPSTLPQGLKDPKNGKGGEVKLLPLIEVAQKKLESLPAVQYSYTQEATGKKNGKQRMRRIMDYDIAFAVAHLASGEIEVVKIPRSKAKRATTTVPLKKGEFSLTFEKWNGCNTPFEVKKPDGYAVLALRCLMGSGKNIESLVYTPYTKDIDTQELRDVGYTYLQKKLVDAATELRKLGVKSQSFPRELASDAVPMSVAFRLALIEHIEPSLIGKTPIAELINKVLVIIAANQGDAYITSMSKAGAYGQFQFIPKTYASMVNRYPAAKLTSGFRPGMRDHLNAAKASLLLFDSDLAVAGPSLRYALRASPYDLALYLAAAYNGGAGRAVRAIEKDKVGFVGGTWRQYLLPETRNYLDKIEEVNKVLK